jgi:Interferon-induced transmembrane protein
MPGPLVPAGYPAPPDNYLVWAILSTVLCCLPLGIASIVFAAQVNEKWARGDVAGAMESSRRAKQFATWSVLVYLGLAVVIVIAYAAFFAIAIATTTVSS